MQPADNANDPLCAEVTVRLPDTVSGQSRRWTDAQATGAWGSPTSVLLKCGLEAPGPTTIPCETVDGVDWLVDDSQAPNFRFTTFGRSPAVEVYLDYDIVGAPSVLDDLSNAVGSLPKTGSVCTDKVVDE